MKTTLLPLFLKVFLLPERATCDIQTFNTLCSASSPVTTSIFSSKYLGDGLEEKAAADSIRDIFLIESVPKKKLGEKTRERPHFLYCTSSLLSPLIYMSTSLFITMTVSQKVKLLEFR